MLLALTAIALVAAAALAALNGVTKDTIAKVEQNKVTAAIADVLKQTDAEGNVLNQIAFETLKDTVVYVGDANAEGKYGDSVVCHRAYDTEGNYVGAAVEAADANGFGGYFKVMIGYDAEGNVYGYRILKTAETPGLGANADQWFQKGHTGDIIGKKTDPELKVKKDKGDVDAITGSTITSRAFLRCVNKGYANLSVALAEQPVVVEEPAMTEENTETENN